MSTKPPSGWTDGLASSCVEVWLPRKRNLHRSPQPLISTGEVAGRYGVSFRWSGELTGDGVFYGTPGSMSKPLVGYARYSTDEQDLSAQRNALMGLGVISKRVYVDHGQTGRPKQRPGLRESLAAGRAGATLLVTKLDRLARSGRDAHDIADDLAERQIELSIGGSIHGPIDPTGKLFFNALAMIAEFEADLVRTRAREGMKATKAKGRLRGKQPKLSAKQEASEANY